VRNSIERAGVVIAGWLSDLRRSAEHCGHPAMHSMWFDDEAQRCVPLSDIGRANVTPVSSDPSPTSDTRRSALPSPSRVFFLLTRWYWYQIETRASVWEMPRDFVYYRN